MNQKKSFPYLIWIDLEMTGLDPDSERIIEIASVVTSSDLSEIIEGPDLVIKQSQNYIDNMDDWNSSHHKSSGLIDCLKVTSVTETEAEQRTLNFLSSYSNKGQSPLCGNSISHDRRFLNRYMPKLASFFHYRNIDISSIKELAKRWYPEMIKGYSKESSHRAMADIRDSINELKIYKDKLFK